MEIRKWFGPIKKTVYGSKEEILKKHPTMHTNNSWPEECTEEPLTKPGSRPASGELNPLCGTILPTSATLSELLFHTHLYSKMVFLFLIHIDIIMEVQMYSEAFHTDPIQLPEQWLRQNITPCCGTVYREQIHTWWHCDAKAVLDLAYNTQQISSLTSLHPTLMILSEHSCLSHYLCIPLDWFRVDRKKSADLGMHSLTNLFVPAE